MVNASVMIGSSMYFLKLGLVLNVCSGLFGSAQPRANARIPVANKLVRDDLRHDRRRLLWHLQAERIRHPPCPSRFHVLSFGVSVLREVLTTKYKEYGIWHTIDLLFNM